MTAKPVPEHISDERPKLTAYEMQVLIGTTISGCNMSPDQIFDLPAAWARLRSLDLTDRADGLAIATPSGRALVEALLTELQHRREAEAGTPSPVAFVTPDTMKDILAQSLWTQGAMGEFRCDNREGFTVPLYAEPTLAASPSSPATGVRVKLEWQGDEAKTPFGRYTVTRTDDGYLAAFEWDEVAHVGFNAVDEPRRAAQDHAQADYEARIRSALGEHP